MKWLILYIAGDKMKIDDKYYDGFEGEPKITFCLMENGSILEAVCTRRLLYYHQ